MALSHEEEDCSHEDKRKNKAQRANTRQNLKKVHLTSEFVSMAKFGGHVLCRLVRM